MFRKFRKALREAGMSRTKRPQWKFRPSMGQLLTELEDRQLLSVSGVHTDATTSRDGSSPKSSEKLSPYKSITLTPTLQRPCMSRLSTAAFCCGAPPE